MPPVVDGACSDGDGPVSFPGLVGSVRSLERNDESSFEFRLTGESTVASRTVDGMTSCSRGSSSHASLLSSISLRLSCSETDDFWKILPLTSKNLTVGREFACFRA